MKSDARRRSSSNPETASNRLAFDDPVPSGSCIAVAEAEQCHPHDVEAEVQRVLLGAPDLEFTSLVVRRVPQGVCLEGVVYGTRQTNDVANLARTVSGVEVVINRLLMCGRK